MPYNTETPITQQEFFDVLQDHTHLVLEEIANNLFITVLVETETGPQEEIYTVTELVYQNNLELELFKDQVNYMNHNVNILTALLAMLIFFQFLIKFFRRD